MIIKRDNENPFDDGLDGFRAIVNALEIMAIILLPFALYVFYVGGFG